MKKRIIHKYSMILVGWGATALFAQAALVINVDFQPNSGSTGGTYSEDYSGQGAFSDPGNNTWNIVSPDPSTGGNDHTTYSEGYYGTGLSGEALVDSSGAATGVSLDMGDTDAYAIDSSHGNYSDIATDATDLMSDYLRTGNFNRYVNLNGLSAGTSYILYLYGASTNVNEETRFTVSNSGGVIGTVDTTGIPSGAHTLTSSQDYVVLTGITTSTGFLGIQYQSNNGASNIGAFNGFQLVESTVPEPTSAILFGMGSMAVLWHRRSRKVPVTQGQTRA